MNKVRRKELQELYDIISETKDHLEILHDEEEGYRDNIPENLQGSNATRDPRQQWRRLTPPYPLWKKLLNT